MSQLHSFRGTISFRSAKAILATLPLFVICMSSTSAQEAPGYVVHPNREVRVADLSSPTSPSANAIAGDLEIILHNPAICCGKNSALENEVTSPSSLQELSSKLQGRHVLGDGRSVVLNAEYTARSSMTPDLIISTLLDQRAPILEWKLHFYVLYGAVFDETRYDDGRRQYAIKRLLLRDPRHLDERGEVSFNRESDDRMK